MEQRIRPLPIDATQLDGLPEKIELHFACLGDDGETMPAPAPRRL